MKTPEELFKLMEEEMPFNILPNSKIKPYILELIGLAQKDAYNQALQDALEEIPTEVLVWSDPYDYSCGVDRVDNDIIPEILKLKKQ